MSYLRVRNWERYQHYRDRRPVWIKLYVELLDDLELKALPLPTRLLFVELLLLAARHDNAIRNEPEKICGVLGMKLSDVTNGIERLRKGRWIHVTNTPRRASKPASSPLAKSLPRERKVFTPLPPSGEKHKTDNKNNGTTTPKTWPRCPKCNIELYLGQTIAQHLHTVHDIETNP